MIPGGKAISGDIGDRGLKDGEVERGDTGTCCGIPPLKCSRTRPVLTHPSADHAPPPSHQRQVRQVVRTSRACIHAYSCTQVSEKKVVKLQTSAPSAVSAHGVDVSSEALIDRSQRFVSATGSTTVSLKGAGAAPANHFAPKTQLGLGGARAGSIRGYSTDLERPYLRLHFAPDPATIRPPDVLEKALALVKKKWVTHHDFRHATEQLMAIQQDCKLQGVESTLTCDAYETLLRIALEQADLAEFTRCLTSLNELYHKADLVSEDWSAHKNEMMAYRMLFLMREDKDMLEKTSALLATFTPSQRADSDIAFACSVCTALLARDFAAFFRLYASAPKMSG